MDACHLVSLGQGDLWGWFWAPRLLGPGDPPGRRGCARVPTSERRWLGSGRGGLVTVSAERMDPPTVLMRASFLFRVNAQHVFLATQVYFFALLPVCC